MRSAGDKFRNKRHKKQQGKLCFNGLVNRKKNIGKIFLGTNIWEYKSPTDSLSINKYYKCFSYLYLFISLECVDINDVTLSFTVTKKPVGLFKHLRGNGKKVTDGSNGLYRIEGEAFPIQVIESKALSHEENIWLKALTNKIEERTYTRIVNLSNAMEKRLNMEAYIETVTTANLNVLKEMRAMRTAALDKAFGEMGFIHIDAVNEKANEAEKRAQAEAERAQAEAERAKKAEARIKELEEMLQDSRR